MKKPHVEELCEQIGGYRGADRDDGGTEDVSVRLLTATNRLQAGLADRNDDQREGAGEQTREDDFVGAALAKALRDEVVTKNVTGWEQAHALFEGQSFDGAPVKNFRKIKLHATKLAMNSAVRMR